MDVTDVIGGFGPFQMRLLLVTAFRSFCSTFMRYNYNYISRTPDFECATPSDPYSTNATNSTESLIWDYDRKRAKFGMAECYREEVVTGSFNDTISVPCQRWIYEPAMHKATIIEEWDLVCWNTWLITLGYMINSIGGICSYIPAGYLADKYGRRPMVLLGQTIICITTFICGFATSPQMYLGLRLVLSIGHGLLGSAASCLKTVGPKQRPKTVVLLAVGGFSTVLLAAVAYTVHDWRTLVILSSLPIQIPLLFFMWKFMPESTRWLLTAKKVEQAEKQIVEQAKINGIKIIDRESVMKALIEKVDNEDGKVPGSVLEILKSKKIRKVALILYTTFALRAIISGGFKISLFQLGGSFHVNMCILGLIRIVISFCNFYILNKLNRRKVIFCSFLFTGVLFLGSAAVPRKLTWLRITMAMLGNLSHGLCSTLLYFLTIEMFPTKIRASALVGSKFAYRIGHFGAPLTDLVGRLYGKYIPSLIYGALSIACFFLLLLLPDTKHEQLPDTITDVENLYNKNNVVKDKKKFNGNCHNNEQIVNESFKGKLIIDNGKKNGNGVC